MEGHKDLVVNGGWDAGGVRARGGQLRGDNLPRLLVKDLVLEDESLTSVRDPISEKGDWELGEVQLVPSAIGAEKVPKVSAAVRLGFFHVPFSKRTTTSLPRCR